MSKEEAGADPCSGLTHHGDDMRHAVSAVDYRSRERPLTNLSRRPGGGQRQDGL